MTKQPAASTSTDEEKTRTAIMQALMAHQPGKVELDPNRPHAFWDNQPVPKLNDKVVDCGPIDVEKTIADVRQEPLTLPAAYEWASVDLTDSEMLDEVYNLLTRHYVEDDDNMFRFDYSREFLRWALMPPGYQRDWHICVRVKGGGKMLAFITAIPVRMQTYEDIRDMVEINFLCIHKKLRSKRLAPVLIREITRRVNLTDRWQAAYTAGVVLPRPVGCSRYYHRSLNPKKLIAVRFSHLPPHLTMASTIKLYRVPEHPSTPGIRPFELRDTDQVQALLANYLSRFDLHPILDSEEVKHYFNPREEVISTFVVDDGTGKITDFVSYYTLCSSIIGNKDYSTLRAAYGYYYVANTVPLKALMSDALVYAKQANMDVFNALDLLENREYFKDLKFGIGDGLLRYYLYNYKCPEMEPTSLGLVLV